MDYDSYEVYERNSPVDCGEEAEIVRERSRRIDRARREREDELQWEQDRSRDRNYGSRSFEDEFLSEGRGYRENNASGKYEDAGFGGGDDFLDCSAAGKTFDYNHGMSGTSQIKRKAELARREASRRLEDNVNAAVSRDPRPSFARDIKDEPSTSIFLGGIPRTLDERDLENELIRCGLRARDIRIIRSKETGANRGFAFVDFHSVPDAQRWMELNQGRLFLRNRFTISMDYSKTGSVGGSNGARGGKSEVLFKDDWKCSRCGCDNFQRRLQCFKCGLSKAESEKVRAKEPAESRSRSGSSSPSCTLVIRGLDGLTEETGVENALGNVCRNCRIRNVFIVRNGTTGIGEGYGYLEFFSRQEAEDVVETIRSMDCPLEIDGKEVLVDYSREAFATVVASISQSMLNSNLNQGYDYDRNASHRYSSYYGETDVQNAPLVHQSNMSSGNVPKSTQYAKQYMAEPAPLSAETLQPTDTGRQGASFPSGTSVTLSDNEFANYASPDLNRYIFDDLTGYYIDPVTGLYYDAGTQYFYQMETGRFLYWDPDKNCYFPASEQGQETKDKETTTTPAKSAEETALSKQEEERLEKANAAKKIAKEMDKWVKAQNSQKESGFKKPLAPISLPPKAKPSGAADAGFNVIAKSKFTIELPKPKEEKKALAAPALPGLVAYSGDSDSDTEADEDDADRAAGEDAERAVEEKLVDWGKLTCLLCRRAFSSADILTKHRQLSDLHKSNLEEYKRKLTGTVTRATTVAKASGITKSTTAKR